MSGPPLIKVENTGPIDDPVDLDDDVEHGCVAYAGPNSRDAAPNSSIDVAFATPLKRDSVADVVTIVDANGQSAPGELSTLPI